MTILMVLVNLKAKYTECYKVNQIRARHSGVIQYFINVRGESIRQVKIVPAENIRPVSESRAPCDWSVVIISTLEYIVMVE